MSTVFSQLYFDHNATTPCDKEVVKTMLPYFTTHFGNASSNHSYGWLGKSAVEDATKSIAENLGITTSSMVYTSGATESANSIIKGVAHKWKDKGKHLITTKAEHKAVLDTHAFLEENGYEVSYLDVDELGLISIDELKNTLRQDTILVSVLYANNETGIVQPLEEISKIVKQHGSLLFSDTTQALGKLDLGKVLPLLDFACFSGHKVYGPKGIGITYINNNHNKDIIPGFVHGGGQQTKQRGGTINTPLIVGMGKAVELAYRQFENDNARIATLRDQLETGLLAVEMATSNTIKAGQRLPNTLHISFPYVDGASLLTALSGKIAVSNGSACNAASVEPSHVAMAMGIPKNLAYASLRLSLGRGTTQEEVRQAIEMISKEVGKQRENNILWERR